MKAIILIFFMLLIVSCAGWQIGEIPPSKVCPPPEGEVSWLCEKSEQLGVTLEQTYGWIYTGAAVGVITDKVDRRWLCDFDKELADWYVKMYPFSYDAVIAEIIARAKLVDDPVKVMLLKNIVNQNLQLYSSPALISAHDDAIIRGGNKKFRAEMYCD